MFLKQEAMRPSVGGPVLSHDLAFGVDSVGKGEDSAGHINRLKPPSSQGVAMSLAVSTRVSPDDDPLAADVNGRSESSSRDINRGERAAPQDIAADLPGRVYM